MTDPDLDPTIAAASLRSPQEISRLTAGLPNLAEQIMGAAVEDSQRASAVAPSRPRWAWPAAFSAAAGVAVIALVVATTVGNRTDETSKSPVPAVSLTSEPSKSSVPSMTSESSAGTDSSTAFVGGSTEPVAVSTSPGVASGSVGTGAPEPAAATITPPPPVVLDAEPVFDDQGLAQAERDRRRADLTPYFQQLVQLDGFVDSTFDLAAETLTVLWHQQVPSEATAIAADAAAEGHRVVVEAVPYTDREIMAVVPTLQEALQAEAVIGFVQVAPDYRSVLVSTVKLAETPELQAKVERIAAPILGAIPLAMYSASDSLTTTGEAWSEFDGILSETFQGLRTSPAFVDGRVDESSRLIVVWWNRQLGEPNSENLQTARDLGVTVRTEVVDESRTFDLATLSDFCRSTIMGDTDGGMFDPPEVNDCRAADDLSGVVVVGPGLGTDQGLQQELITFVDEFSVGAIPMAFEDFDPSDPPELSAMDREAERREAAREIQKAADPYWDRITDMDGFLDGGYGIEGEPERPGLTITWDGPHTSELETVITDAAAAGVTIELIDVTYTEDKIFEAGAELIDVLQADGIEISLIGPMSYYTGLRLGGPDLSYSVEMQDRARELAEPYLDGMPLEFEDKTSVVQDMIDGIPPTFG